MQQLKSIQKHIQYIFKPSQASSKYHRHEAKLKQAEYCKNMKTLASLPGKDSCSGRKP